MDDKFDQLSLHEILQFIASFGEAKRPASEGIKLYERLMNIAFMEHGVSESDRSLAEQLAEKIKSSLMQSDQWAVIRESFEEAVAYQHDYFKRFGKGEPVWELEESEYTSEQTEADVAAALQEHLDKTSDTLSALAFSVHYYVAELLSMALQRQIASPDEIGSIFDRLENLMEHEPNACYREKVENMARMIRETVLS